MNKEEQKEYLDKYDKRETFWSEQSLQQIGYSLNFFLTIGVAFLGYLVTLRKEYPKFYFEWLGQADWQLITYYSALLIVFSSVTVGIISILIRLYDLRVTRHITSARKKAIKNIRKLYQKIMLT